MKHVHLPVWEKMIVRVLLVNLLTQASQMPTYAQHRHQSTLGRYSYPRLGVAQRCRIIPVSSLDVIRITVVVKNLSMWMSMRCESQEKPVQLGIAKSNFRG